MTNPDHKRILENKQRILQQRLSSGQLTGVLTLPDCQTITEPISKTQLNNRALVLTKRELRELKGIEIVPCYSSLDNPTPILLEADENMSHWQEEDPLIIFPEELA